MLIKQDSSICSLSHKRTRRVGLELVDVLLVNLMGIIVGSLLSKIPGFEQGNTVVKYRGKKRKGSVQTFVWFLQEFYKKFLKKFLSKQKNKFTIHFNTASSTNRRHQIIKNIGKCIKCFSLD